MTKTIGMNKERMSILNNSSQTIVHDDANCVSVKHTTNLTESNIEMNELYELKTGTSSDGFEHYKNIGDELFIECVTNKTETIWKIQKS